MDTSPYRPFADAAAREHVDTQAQLTRRELAFSWLCRLVAAGIMLETLFFKFTGAAESVWIFSRMNMEAWGRYGQGGWELIASVLLLLPRTVWLGCFLALGAMGAAIVSHLTVLGVVVRGDHGLLFAMACTTFSASLVTLWLHQRSIPRITPLNDWPE
jgi:putative oxidoreductase